MDTFEIDIVLSNLLSTTQCRWLGVYARDKLPLISENDHFPLCLVANIDDSSSPGTHWVGFFLTQASNIEFFDSFALPPGMYKFLLPNNEIYCVFSKPIQSLDSNMCGYFCIFALYHRALGHMPGPIASAFSSFNYSWNERLVHKFLQKIGFHTRIRPHISKSGLYQTCITFKQFQCSHVV